MVERAAVDAWIAAYERLWRTAGTDALTELFAEDATYSTAPYAQPHVGIDALRKLWDKEREGPDEVFTMSHEVVAVDGDTAVARLEVRYGDPVKQEWRDLWIMHFGADGRC